MCWLSRAAGCCEVSFFEKERSFLAMTYFPRPLRAKYRGR